MFLAATFVGWIGGDCVYGKVAAKNNGNMAHYKFCIVNFVLYISLIAIMFRFGSDS